MLQQIKYANPSSMLEEFWDEDEEDIEEWRGVNLADGELVDL